MKEGINLNYEFDSSAKVKLFTEHDRLLLAKQVLIFIFIFTAIICIAYGYCPENKAVQQMFELIKIGVLPLITLVISFYFPNSKGN